MAGDKQDKMAFVRPNRNENANIIYRSPQHGSSSHGSESLHLPSQYAASVHGLSDHGSNLRLPQNYHNHGSSHHGSSHHGSSHHGSSHHGSSSRRSSHSKSSNHGSTHSKSSHGGSSHHGSSHHGSSRQSEPSLRSSSSHHGSHHGSHRSNHSDDRQSRTGIQPPVPQYTNDWSSDRGVRVAQPMNLNAGPAGNYPAFQGGDRANLGQMPIGVQPMMPQVIAVEPRDTNVYDNDDGFPPSNTGGGRHGGHGSSRAPSHSSSRKSSGRMELYFGAPNHKGERTLRHDGDKKYDE